LADLIRPLADPQIAATTGNRWFSSPSSNLGTALREVWNAAAIVQMQLYNIAWGGSLAIKRTCLESTNLISRWEQAFCEDTMISDELSQQGFKLVRVPDLILVNRESTSFGDAVNWIIRQLLTIRLHHSKWYLVQAHAAATCFSIISLIVAFGFLWFGQLQASSIVFVGLAIYQVANAILLKRIQTINLQIVNQRLSAGQELSTETASLNRWLAVGLAQLVQPYACIKASTLKDVRWRGVDYRIEGRGKIALTRYQPYAEIAANESAAQSQSIY
jgi:cellulose synthase/poly-beta-1,6-N-acetylglucosamine synthase-like glycosyltransferase